MENNKLPEASGGNESGMPEKNGNGMPRPDKNIPPFFEKCWAVIKGYWITIKGWFATRKVSKNDKWALAICLLMSVVVWLYVMSTDDTGFQMELTSVTVSLEGTSALKDSNMSVINGYDNIVTVTLKGKRGDIGGLTSDELNVYVDLSGVTETGRHTLPVKVEIPENSTLVSVEPSSVSVKVDVNSSIDVDVRVKMDYVLDASYTLGEPVPDYRSVIVSGPKSVLDTIRYAAAKFDVGTIKSSMTLAGTLALYDEYDNVINNPCLKCNVTEISVYVPVTMTKTVPLTVTFTNGISTNYNVTIRPAEITIVGDPQVLKDISEISVYSINDGDVIVGEPLIKHISSLELPAGVVMKDAEKGVSISIDRLY